METVNNIATAASRAIWGDTNGEVNEKSGEEPVSGELGNVAAGEPYDKGNDDEPASTTTSTKEPSSTINDSGVGLTPSVDADPVPAPQQTQKHLGTDHIAEAKTTDEAAENDLTTTSPPTSENKTTDNGSAGGVTSSGTLSAGTGLEHIDRSGGNADAGDSDTAGTRAGTETDHTVDTKGTQHEQPDQDLPSGNQEIAAVDTDTSKPSLKEKIKAKLHRNKD